MEDEMRKSIASLLQVKTRREALENSVSFQQTQKNIKLLKKNENVIKQQLIGLMVKLDRKRLEVEQPLGIILTIEDKKMPSKFDHSTVENGVRRALETSTPENSNKVIECIEEVAKESFYSALENHRNKGNISKCYDLKINKTIEGLAMPPVPQSDQY